MKHVITLNAYSSTDHATWARYHKRQTDLVTKLACRQFIAGFRKLGLNPRHIPDRRSTSARLRRMTGWTLTSAGSKNVSMKKWFEAMRMREFPVTDYIRPPHQFDYTPNPDLLHEYYGHLPFLTDKRFADLAHRFGVMCHRANARQLLQISRLWSLTVEFGLIEEYGKLKLLGAGLLSSYGEALHAAEAIKKGNVVPFNLKEVIATPGRTYQWHKKYVVVKDLDEIGTALAEYGSKEGLV